MSLRRRLLVLGLDGATFDVIRPLADAGRLPNLAAMLREGAAAPLPSTVPAMTFPAWSTFLTGLEPGRHGLFDFTQKLPGAYRIRFTNATDRCGATFFGRVSRAGGRVLALGMPATHPPEPLDGLLVSGFDAPVSRGSDASRASDPDLYRAVAERVGPWMTPDLDEGAEDDAWHDRAIGVLAGRVERKTRFALEALRRMGRIDLACIVFSESDTVAHHFWRDHDPDSPRHDPGASAARRGAVGHVYQALDAACGELREAFGADAGCLVVSDHGSGGAARRVVHLNRRLAECGLLARRAGPAWDRGARALRDLALAVLPPRLAEGLFRRVRGTAAGIESAARFGGLDWSRTAAFSEEANTQPGVWINLAGREDAGSVAPDDYERVRDDVIAALGEWRLPGGEPVVARARRREEVYAGPCVERAPDLVVELGLDAGYGLSLVPTPWWREDASSVRTLEDHQLAGGRGRGMNGVHRPEGVVMASGAGLAGANLEGVRMADLAPTVLTHLGVPWDEALDGAAREPRPYSDAEEAAAADRLRALGYLE